jgi:hypothetical protein
LKKFAFDSGEEKINLIAIIPHEHWQSILACDDETFEASRFTILASGRVVETSKDESII